MTTTGYELGKRAAFIAMLVVAGCTPEGARFCFGDGLCVEPDGQKVLPDGQPVCELHGCCGDCDVETDGGDESGDPAAPTGDRDLPPCEGCSVTADDSDGDCIPNNLEDADGDGVAQAWEDDGDGCFETGESAGESNPNNSDTDGDGILDGCEDRNQDGIHNLGETISWHPDTDCDGITDGLEDANQNGRVDLVESSPINIDSDFDGLGDGREDRDLDGILDPWEDLNGNECWDVGEPGETSPGDSDTDGDGIADGIEDVNTDGLCSFNESCGFLLDTDCDELTDGIEDENRSGTHNRYETSAVNTDTDGDGISDGIEDADHDGFWDDDETHPLRRDTDGDGLTDGEEDRDFDGIVSPWEDLNANGCWDSGEPEGETDPRLSDSDADLVLDRAEDANRDGVCNVDATGSFIETCAFHVDSDCDGLDDGEEDGDHNGRHDLGETDPRRKDTDLDGLADGCHPAGDLDLCEDQSNDGTVDPDETDPTLFDTDGDGLDDGCELRFASDDCGQAVCPTNALDPDTDGDFLADGEEDRNHNCLYEPTLQVCDDDGSCELETNPRVADPERTDPRSQTCATINLKRVSIAGSSAPHLDYQLAFEIEESEAFGEAVYVTQPFGQNNGTIAEGFALDDPDDLHLGHTFQSPSGVVNDDAIGRVNRDIYGFVMAVENAGDLDSYLFDLGIAVEQLSELDSVVTAASASAVAAHDSLPSAIAPNGGDYPIWFGQRRYDRKTHSLMSAVGLRKLLLEDRLAAEDMDGVEWQGSTPDVDEVYGEIRCDEGSTTNCYDSFDLYVTGVHRVQQRGPSGGRGVIVLVFALTPDDSQLSFTAERLHAERLVRLDDLTGGSALARSTALQSRACDERSQAVSRADILWVVDDSGSMQANIDKLQLAAADGRAVLTANAGIVDFRTSFTTTNPGRSARSRCTDSCAGDCSNCSCDGHLGCIKLCPGATCNSDCTGTCTGFCDPAEGCTPIAERPEAVCVDVTGTTDCSGLDGDGAHHLPGGGGTFYYEDTLYWDCSVSSAGIQSCATNSNMAQFFNAAPRAFREHMGFLGSTTPCDADMSLLDITGAASAGCSGTNAQCCPRLTAACTDGPTVLASQMCDLIRAMAGLSPPGSDVLGARPHSAYEQGVRGARRLIESMLPALPLDHPDSDEARLHLRRPCTAGPECQPCDPRDDPTCTIVPLVTLFFADEEDFYFKDDCASTQSVADISQLPADCVWKDGDPTTAIDGDKCDLAYCAGFSAGPPTGFNPDAEATSTSTGFPWRNATAPECASTVADLDDSCVLDPCIGQPDATTCDSITIDVDEVDVPYCVWSTATASCMNRCRAAYDPAVNDDVAAANCEVDPLCRWERGYIDHQDRAFFGTGPTPCVMRYPVNDCMACKRYLRTQEAVAGATIDPFSGTRLVGFDAVGPVYAVVRREGEQGFGGGIPGAPTDRCDGGARTWGRGDGRAFRDLAAATDGLTQDVCADSFVAFFSDIMAKAASLSDPYPLSRTPIAATLKVGIGRDDPLGGQTLSIPVPRSQRQGFIYDPAGNGIAFRADPIDGACDPGRCSLNGVLEPSEIEYAAGADYIPRTGDAIFISYRTWEPVPCREKCASGESCGPISCPAAPDGEPCTDDSECWLNHVCDEGTGTCVLDCASGERVFDCTGQCGLCETLDNNPIGGGPPVCEPIGDLCECNPSGAAPCSPDSPFACELGFTCDEGTCACAPVPGCADGFTGDDSVPTCQASVECCQRWAGGAEKCTEIADAITCEGSPPQEACDALALDNSTPDPVDGLTECQRATPCEWDDHRGCHFAYQTCCGSGEEAYCFIDHEAGTAQVECDPQCVCDPPCAEFQRCEPDSQSGGCSCQGVPP